MEERKSSQPNHWLQRVQEQSWEPEILISGIVLFALFQIPPYIRQAALYLDVYSIQIFSGGTVDEVLSAVLLSANYWLIAGFTIHLIGRSIWVAFIGLSYVYRDGVKTNNLKFKEPYKSIVSKTEDYQSMIVKLEGFCSRVFAASFLLFMCVLGVFFFTAIVGLVIAVLLEIDPDLNRYSTYVDPVLQVVGIVYLLDFVTVGLIKRMPYVRKIYYPFYKVMSFLTLAPLYRGIYYGFASHHKAWKLGVAMFVFALITFFMALGIRKDTNFANIIQLEIDRGEDYLYPGNYRNLAGDKPSKRIIVESDVIDANHMKVFLVQSSEFEENQIMERCNYDSISQQEGINTDSLKRECLSAFYLLLLNGDTLNPRYFPTHDRELNRHGLVTYVDLGSLPRGAHTLELYYRFLSEDGSTSPILVGDVEFYKTVDRKQEKIDSLGTF